MSEFWYRQDIASLPSEQRQGLVTRQQHLKSRQLELKTLIDELERRGASQEEWDAYDKAFAEWNNDVMDLVEDVNMPLDQAVGTGTNFIVTPDTFDNFLTTMEGSEVPFEGNRRLGEGGLSN